MPVVVSNVIRIRTWTEPELFDLHLLVQKLTRRLVESEMSGWEYGLGQEHNRTTVYVTLGLWRPPAA